MGNHYQLRADGISGPAEAKLLGRGRRESSRGFDHNRKMTPFSPVNTKEVFGVHVE